MHSRLVEVPIEAQRLSVFDLLEEKRRTVVFADCSLASFTSFPFQMASYLTSQSMVFSRFVVPFFYSDLIVDTILAYLVSIFISITACRSVPILLILRSNSSIIRLQI